MIVSSRRSQNHGLIPQAKARDLPLKVIRVNDSKEIPYHCQSGTGFFKSFLGTHCRGKRLIQYDTVFLIIFLFFAVYNFFTILNNNRILFCVPIHFRAKGFRYPACGKHYSAIYNLRHYVQNNRFAIYCHYAFCSC